MFYDMTHPDYKNKKKRDFVTKEFAQSLFPSGMYFFVIQIYFSLESLFNQYLQN